LRYRSTTCRDILATLPAGRQGDAYCRSWRCRGATVAGPSRPERPTPGSRLSLGEEPPTVTMASSGDANTRPPAGADPRVRRSRARAVIVQSQADGDAQAPSGLDMYAFVADGDGRRPGAVIQGPGRQPGFRPDAVPLVYPGSTVLAKRMPDGEDHEIVIDWARGRLPRSEAGLTDFQWGGEGPPRSRQNTLKQGDGNGRRPQNNWKLWFCRTRCLARDLRGGLLRRDPAEPETPPTRRSRPACSRARQALNQAQKQLSTAGQQVGTAAPQVQAGADQELAADRFACRRPGTDVGKLEGLPDEVRPLSQGKWWPVGCCNTRRGHESTRHHRRRLAAVQTREPRYVKRTSATVGARGPTQGPLSVTVAAS